MEIAPAASHAENLNLRDFLLTAGKAGLEEGMLAFSNFWTLRVNKSIYSTTDRFAPLRIGR